MLPDELARGPLSSPVDPELCCSILGSIYLQVSDVSIGYKDPFGTHIVLLNRPVKVRVVPSSSPVTVCGVYKNLVEGSMSSSAGCRISWLGCRDALLLLDGPASTLSIGSWASLRPIVSP